MIHIFKIINISLDTNNVQHDSDKVNNYVASFPEAPMI